MQEQRPGERPKEEREEQDRDRPRQPTGSSQLVVGDLKKGGANRDRAVYLAQMTNLHGQLNQYNKKKASQHLSSGCENWQAKYNNPK